MPLAGGTRGAHSTANRKEKHKYVRECNLWVSVDTNGTSGGKK